MHFGNFRFGMRTFKSALAVMLCILIFHLTNRGEPMIAALSAVFSMRQDLPTTLSFGKSRILSNSLGGSLAIIYILIQNQFQFQFAFELILVPVFVALVIIISDGIKNQAGIISGVSTLLLITLSIRGEESLSYAIARVIDTFIGTMIAVGLNYFIPLKNTTKKN